MYISETAMILLIITGGGLFKQVLTNSGTGGYMASLSRQWAIPPLLPGWLVMAMMYWMIGFLTLSPVTAAGFVSPLELSGQAAKQ